MNITFLIGNGFDVNLGLKTKYTDFYDKYIEANKTTTQECIKNFVNKIKDNYENWSDFEEAFAENVEGTDREVGLILSNFCDLFTEYLQEECKKCDYSSSDIINKELIKFIVTPYYFLERKDEKSLEAFYNSHRKEDTIYNFINFNYTDTLEKLLINPYNRFIQHNVSVDNRGYKNTLKPILYLHGKIYEEYIIIGIDGLYQLRKIKNSDNSRLARNCVKYDINVDNGYQEKETRFKSIINSSNIIYTYGVSFGNTDRSRWNVICDWLSKSKDNKIIIFKYDSGFSKYESKHRGLLHNYIDDTRMDYLEMFCLGDPEKIEAIKSNLEQQIFVIDSSKALNFKLIEDKISIPV